MKAMYGWLHTHQWKSRIYSSTSTCPFCEEEDSNDHIWICRETITNREEQLNKFLSSIDAKTPTYMTMILRQRLEAILALPSTIEHPEDILPDEVSRAVDSQDDLGWINFIRGRHSTDLEDAYDIYLEREQGKKAYRSGRAWATQLVKHSLTLLVGIWYARNDQFHSNDDGEITLSHEIQEIHQRVRETYADKRLYNRAMRAKLFDMTLDQRLQQRPFQLVKWIQTVEMTAQIVKPIYSHYHPTRPPDDLNMMATI
jgi:hypothetical protein